MTKPILTARSAATWRSGYARSLRDPLPLSLMISNSERIGKGSWQSAFQKDPQADIVPNGYYRAALI